MEKIQQGASPLGVWGDISEGRWSEWIPAGERWGETAEQKAQAQDERRVWRGTLAIGPEKGEDPQLDEAEGQQRVCVTLAEHKTEDVPVSPSCPRAGGPSL